jgi:phosphoribosylglycinamide formyltransferase 1
VLQSDFSFLMISDATVKPDAFEQTSFISPDVPPSVLYNSAIPPLRLGILASGSGSNVEAIAQAIAQQELNAQIQVLVYNNPQARVTERADRLGIPKVLHNHREYASREALDQAIIDTMRQHQVDWVIMAGWMRVVTQLLIDAYPKRILNIHPSLLPSFPGAHAIEQAIAARVKITGCTVHIVELVVDSGPIVMQSAVPVLPHDTAETLHQRVQIQEHRIFPRAIALAAQQSGVLGR